MLLKNDRCQISITLDKSYIIGSNNYDVIINLGDYTEKGDYNVLVVSVSLYSEQYTVALIGSCYQSYDENCALLENEILTVMQGNRIVQFNVKNRNIMASYNTELDGCAFGIYNTDEGYIIHGELEIAMYDKSFNKKWDFSGRDIFVSITNKQAFRLLEDRICLYDFEDNYYELDYGGKLLVDKPHR